MTRPKKPIDDNTYLKILGGAFVTYEKSPKGSARLLVRVASPNGDHFMLGLSFDDVRVVDGLVEALIRARAEIVGPIHPHLKGFTGDGPIH